MRRIRICFALFSVLAIPWAVGAAEFTSTDFQALDPVIVSGEYSTSSDYALWGAIAQIATGTSTSNSFEVRSGFLYFPASAATPASTPAASSAAPADGIVLGSLALDLLRTFLPLTVEQTAERVVVFPCAQSTDFNCDGKIGVEDLSIFLYASASPQRALADLNRDGKVDIKDISILFFHWTARSFAISSSERRLFSAASIGREQETSAPSFLSDTARSGGFATVWESASRKEKSGAQAALKKVLQLNRQAADYARGIFDLWKNVFMSIIDAVKNGIYFLAVWITMQ